MTSRYFRCRTCAQTIHADAAAVTCPSCGDGTARIDRSAVDARKDRIVFLRSATNQEQGALSGIMDEIGREAEWIQAATLAVADGRCTPQEARTLLESMRRRFREVRPLVALLEATAAGTPEHRPVPVDADDLDKIEKEAKELEERRKAIEGLYNTLRVIGINKKNRDIPISNDNAGLPATRGEIIGGSAIIMGLLGILGWIVWNLRSALSGWVW